MSALASGDAPLVLLVMLPLARFRRRGKVSLDGIQEMGE